MFHRATLLAVLLIALIAYGATGQIRVLCTTTIIGDVVANVAGDGIEVDVLLPTNTDPHAFEMTPQDLIRLSQADLIFANGAGLEEFLSPFLNEITVPIVDLSATLTLRDLSGTISQTTERGLGEIGTADPHVWFDPTNVAAWTDAIASTLQGLDPDGAVGYSTRAADYARQLTDLDAWIQEQVAQLPQDNRRLVTDHDAFGYFVARYGFELIGTVFPGFSTLSEPSARDIAALEDAIASFGTPTIFVGTTVNPSLAERIAGDTGVKIAFLYTGSLSDADGPAATYLAFMRYDVDQIVKGLQTP
jgi:manganese/iron transport system substrate-binding protein